jgi:hypothetical protein
MVRNKICMGGKDEEKIIPIHHLIGYSESEAKSTKKFDRLSKNPLNVVQVKM